jgi:molybdate transport system regulatory protein
MRTKDGKAVSVRLRFAEHARLGPGKMALLQAVRQTGSIAAAGRTMNMSFRRAWLLIDSVNAMFDEPAVRTTGTGEADARSTLTPLGEALLAAYLAAEADAERAVALRFAALLPRLRSEPAEPRSPPQRAE